MRLARIIACRLGSDCSYAPAVAPHPSGMITKPTQDVVVRLAPPLTLSEAQCLEMVDIIGTTLKSFD